MLVLELFGLTYGFSELNHIVNTFFGRGAESHRDNAYGLVGLHASIRAFVDSIRVEAHLFLSCWAAACSWDQDFAAFDCWNQAGRTTFLRGGEGRERRARWTFFGGFPLFLLVPTLLVGSNLFWGSLFCLFVPFLVGSNLWVGFGSQPFNELVRGKPTSTTSVGPVP